MNTEEVATPKSIHTKIYSLIGICFVILLALLIFSFNSPATIEKEQNLQYVLHPLK